MKKALFFKQSKPLTVIILGACFALLSVFSMYYETGKSEQIITMLFISLILLGYSISFEMHESFNHKKHFKVFGITLFKWKLDCLSPEYITVFSARNIKSSEWGPVSAMGNQLQEQNYVIRMFKGNKHFTVWRTKSESLARTKAEQLAKMLKVETRF